MKPFNVLKKRTTLFLLLVTAMGINMSWLQFDNNKEISGSTTLASRSALDKACPVDALSCELVLEYGEDKKQARYQYNIEQVNYETNTEAQGPFGTSQILMSIPTSRGDKEYFRVTIVDTDCASCSPITRTQSFALGSTDGIQMLQSLHKMAASLISADLNAKDAEAKLLKKQEEEEKKRLAKIENCEINDEGDKLKKTSMEYFECLGDRIDGAVDEKEERKFLAKMKEAGNKAIFQSGADVRADFLEFIDGYASAFDDNSDFGRFFNSMSYTATSVNNIEALTRASVMTQDKGRRLQINNAIDREFARYQHKMAYSGASLTYLGQKYALNIHQLASMAQESPEHAFHSLMRSQSDGDINSLLLSGASILNLDGTPLIGADNLLGTAPLLTSQVVANSGRYLRSSTYGFQSIPQVGQIVPLNRDTISLGTNSLLTPSADQINRNNILSGIPVAGSRQQLYTGQRFNPLAGN